MKRRTVALLLALPLIAALAGAGIVSLARQRETVYTVPALYGAFTHDRAAWAGKTVLVHGAITTMDSISPCSAENCRGFGFRVSDASRTFLWVGEEPPSSVTATLRRVPLLGLLAPAPQQPRLRIPATYRIELLPRTMCAAWGCYDGLLIDAMPQPPSRPYVGFLSASESFTGVGGPVPTARNGRVQKQCPTESACAPHTHKP